MKQDMQMSLTPFGRKVSLLRQAAPRIACRTEEPPAIDCDLFYLCSRKLMLNEIIYIVKLLAYPWLSDCKYLREN